MSFNDFRYPPYLYLTQVAEHCPKALSTYLSLWRERASNNKITVYKEEIRLQFLTSLAKFRHDLFLLVKEGLVSIDETPKSINIELVSWDEEND